jgi:Tfp pilus assembly protein PilV
VSRLRRLLRRDERGITLVELLMTTVIMSIVLTSLTTLFIQGTNAELDMNNRFQAQLNARLSLDRLRRDLHCSSAGTVTNSGATLTVTDPCINANANNLSWCTAGSGSRWKLYRAVGNPASCSSTSTQFTDFITVANGRIFWYDAPWSNSLGKIHVDLAINVKPSRTVNTYELCDVIVMRNTVRTGSQVATVPATTPRC